MTQSKLKWWILLQLLLVDQALCRAPQPPPPPRTPPLPAAPAAQSEGPTAKQNQPPGGPPPPPPPPTTTEETVTSSRREDRLLAALGAKLRGTPLWRGAGGVRPNASCEELLAASSPSPALFLRELLGLALVPVLVASGCPAEARVLVLRLYELLGADDTDQLLMELEGLMERRGPPRGPASSEGKEAQEGPRLQAVMFNIRQLAGAGEGGERRGGRRSWGGQRADRCEGWTRVNGTLLLGEEAAVGAGARGGLEEAVRACESLGARCAGVSRGDDSGGALEPGLYRAVMKTPGSRAVPSERADSECWIRQCREEEEDEGAWSFPRRGRRSPQTACVDEQERRVYGVVEWLPGVSTFYNLGTAVYYAAVNCSETAKERALMSAVDLGTDALMAVTGGAAGVAGYALGAGFKTGVKAGIKYMMNTMRQEEDVMVNQHSWEDGVIDVQ